MIVDKVITAGAFLVAITTALASVNASGSRKDALGATAGITLFTAFGFGASSMLGTYRVRRCARAVEVWQLNQQMQMQMQMQQGYSPPPAPVTP